MTPRATSESRAGPWCSRRFDVVAALLVLVAQAVWWPLGPQWLGDSTAGRDLWVGIAPACVAAVAAALRRIAAESALAVALVCAVLGFAIPAGVDTTNGPGASDLICGPLAVALTVYSLAVHRTATVSAIGASAVPLVGAGYVLARGSGGRAALGTAVLLAAAVAVLWSSGRLHRRVRTRRLAVRDYRAGAHALLAHAAVTERHRLAAELHDVAAHRMTAVVVSAAAALRLSDRDREADALAHALREGRETVEDLDRIVTLGADSDRIGEADVERLVAEHGVDVYHHSGAPLSVAQAQLTYRVVREALTNVTRYADGSATEVRIQNASDRLLVTVADDGGCVIGGDLGSGTGLAGLGAAVRAAGGVLDAGPHGTGWKVSVEVPALDSALPGLRLATAMGDRALAILATGLSLGVVLLPSDDDPDLLSGPGAAAVLLVPLLSHAATLGWRRTHPLPAFSVAMSILGLWVLAGHARSAGPDPAQVFLASWWIELILVYSIGAYARAGRHGWWVPGAVALVGGAALSGGAGIHGNRIGVAAVLAVLLLPMTILAWWAGRVVLVARRRRAARDLRARIADQEAAAAAASLSRMRLAGDLRGDARRHAVAVSVAARDGRLADVLTEGRATLAALRVLVHTPADHVPEPPPTMLGLEYLAVRRHASLVITRSAAPLPAALEVMIYRATAVVLGDGAAAEVRVGPAGVDISVRGGRTPGEQVLQSLLDMVDAADGRAEFVRDQETVRIWLPRTPI
ncbi:histidine kinase [Actinoplanes sp. CA-252034]|uniref:sensor histidine kinase n=1 Tax=Actinoplanes sp. CA-252034 TaxID=3239906 RepID=UPI003D95B093